MKQIEFKTSKGEFVVIELYDTIDKTSLSLDNGFLTYRDHIGWDGMRIMDSDCISLGSITNITEEQAKEVVDETVWTFDDGNEMHYRNYETESELDFTDIFLHTAIESLNSLLEANGVVFENPLGNEPLTYIDRFSGEKKLRLDWLNMNDKVWNKQQTYLFKMI